MSRGPVPWEAAAVCAGGLRGQRVVELAALAGVEITSLEVVIDAGVDLRGAYDVADVRVGLAEATIEFRVEANAEPHVLDDLARAAVRTSPVAASLASPIFLQIAGRPSG